MSKPKILITRPDIPQESIDVLKTDFDLEIYDQEKPMPKEDLLNMITGKDGLLCMLTDTVDAEVIAAAGEQLKVIATMSIGYDHIDVDSCKDRNIVVCNIPSGISTDSIAEWAVLLMIATGRLFVDSATAVPDGKWIYSWGPVWLCGDGLMNKVVGIVGMGRLGLSILKKIQPFEVKQVQYYDIYHPIKPAERLNATFAELDDLMKTSDYVVSTLMLTKLTQGTFCKATFELMQPSAVFVNVGSGEVVKQEDLYDVLSTKTIRAAALDVTCPEPLPQDDPLLTLNNIIITPRIGAGQVAVRTNGAKIAAQNIFNVLRGKDALNPVL